LPPAQRFYYRWLLKRKEEAEKEAKRQSNTEK
jgi:hypothetical protein